MPPFVIAVLGILGVVGVVGAAGPACAPTNPFDPAAPADLQEKASIRGRIALLASGDQVSDAALRQFLQGIEITLRDPSGAELRENGAVAVHGLDGVDEGARPDDGGSFRFDNLVPGAYGVDVKLNAAAGLFAPAAVGTVTVAAGEDHNLGTVTLPFVAGNAQGGGPASIDGQVTLEDGGDAERTITLFRLSAAGVEQARSVVSGDGTFSFTGLSLDDYAVVATAQGHTTHYQLDVDLAEAQSQSFTAASSFELFPITAVLLPIDSPQVFVDEGIAYVNDDSVPLAVLAFGGVNKMRLSTSPDFVDAAGADVPFSPFSASTTLGLPTDREGTIPVFAQFRAESGAFSFTSETFSTDVVRDRSPPAVIDARAVGLPLDAEGRALAKSGALTVDIDAQDIVSAVDGIAVVVADEEPAAFDSLEDVTSQGGLVRITRSINVAGDGPTSVWIAVRDRARNLSPAFEVPILVDRTPPLSGAALLVDNAPGGVLSTRVAQLRLDPVDAADDPPLGLEISAVTGGGQRSLTGLIPFSPVVAVDLPPDLADDGSQITFQAVATDRVGNTRTITSQQVQLSLRGAVAGTVALEGVPLITPTHAGALVRALDAGGAEVATTVTAADGSFALADLPEGGGYTLDVTLGGYARRVVGPLAVPALAPGDPAVAVAPIPLPLARGSITGLFRLQDHASETVNNAGIVVTLHLHGSTRSFDDVTQTAGDGRYTFRDVPATTPAESYFIEASADQFANANAESGAVADTVTRVQNDAVLVLGRVSGDFDVCRVVAGTCTPAQFFNTDSVAVHLRSTLAVAEMRVVARAAADAPLSPDDVDPPFAPFDPVNQTSVALPAVEGAIAVYVQTRDSLGNAGPVLTGDVVRDVTPPTLLAVARVPSAAALDARFTNVPFVDVDVSADPGPGVVAPLDVAHAAVTDAPPADGSIPPGALACATASSCHVLLPGADTNTVVEKLHDVFAWACDAAGNCALPDHTFVVFDKTAPRAANGAGFNVVTTGTGAGGVGLVTSTATRLLLAAGTAKTTGGAAVVDENGAGSADAIAYRAALSSGTLASTTLRRIDPTPAPGDANIAADGPTLPDLDGSYTVVLQLVDAAGNASLAEPPAFSKNIALDRAPPTGTIDVTPTITNATTVPAVLSYSSDTVAVAFSGVALDCSTAAYSAATGSPQAVNVSILAGDGGKIVNACFKDAAGNTSSAFDIVTLDQTPPPASIAFAGGATVTFTPTVNVNVTAPPDATAVALAEGTSINCGTASFQSLTAPAINLSTGSAPQDGLRTVIACVKDAAGNTTVTSPIGILLDRFAPAGTLVVDGGAAVTNDRRFALTFTASSDVTQMAISSVDPVCDSPAVTYEGFQAVKLIDIPPAVPDGTNTVFACLKEAAGRTVKVSDSILLDTTAPNGSIVINGGAATTSLRDVTISATFDAEVNGMALSQVPLDCRTATYTAPATSSPLTLQTAGGFATVFACFKDAAFNTRAANDSIFVEQAANGSLVVAVNGGANASTSRNVTVSLLAPADAVQMKVAEAQTLDCANPTGYEAFSSSKALTLSGGAAPAEGIKTVSACVQTSSNQTLFASDTILVDTFTPDGTVTVNAGAAQTNNPVVTVVVVPDAQSSDVTDIAVGSTVGSCGTFQPFTSTLAFTLSGADGVKTVDACLRDAAGNIRERQATIALDRAPPSAVSLTLPAFSSSTNVTATLAATGASQAAVAEGALDCATTVLYVPFATSLPVSLTAIDGPRSVSACFKDAAGNIATASAVTVLDTIGPSAADASVVINGGAAFATSAALSVAVTAPSDVTLMSVGTTNPGSCSGASTPFTTPVAVNISPATDGTKTVFVCLKDGAGHAALFSDTITLDVTPPAPTSLQIEAGAAATKTRAVQIAVNGAPADTAQMSVADGAIASCASATYVPFVATFSRTLPAGDGNKQVSLCLKDAAGNTQTTPSSATIALDTLAPALPGNAVALVSHAAGDGAGFTVAGVVDLALNFSPGAGEEIEVKHGEGALDCSSGAYTALPGASPLAVANIALSAGDGTKTYAACFRDAAGNTTLASSTIVRDGTAPAVTSAVCTDCTSDGATLFRSGTSATIAVTSDESGAGLASARVSVDGGAEAGSALTAGAVTVALSSEGSHTFDLRLVDRAGNVSATARRVTIVRDTVIPVLPTSTSFLLNGQNSGGATNSTAVAVTVAGAPADVVSMALGETTIDCTTATYVPFSPATSFGLSSSQGAKTVKLCLQDRAGNKSASAEPKHSASITLDTLPPSLPATAVTIQDGDGFLQAEASINVLLSWNVAGDPKLVKLGESTVDCAGAAGYQALPAAGTSTTVSFAVSGGDGAKVIAACFKDAAGNVATAQDGTVRDGTAPSVTSTVCADCTSDGATLFRSGTNATVAVTSDETGSGLASARVSVDGGAEAGAALTAGAVTVALSSEGSHTFDVKLVDAAGNVSAAARRITIVRDTVIPVLAAGTSFLLNGQNSGGFTSSATLAVTIGGAPADVVSMALAETTIDCATASYVPFAPATTFSVSSSQGPKTVKLCLQDRAGNKSATAEPKHSASITLDSLPPSLPAGAVAIQDGDGFLQAEASVNVLLSWNVAGDPKEVKLGESTVDCAGAAGYQALPAAGTSTTVSFAVSAGDGAKVIAACFKDAAGNVSLAQDTTIRDNTAPGGTVVVAGGAAKTRLTTSIPVAVTSTAADVTQMAIIDVTAGSTATCANATYGAFASTAALAAFASTTNNTKTVAVCFRDQAGNQSATPAATDTIALDTQLSVTGIAVALAGTKKGGAADGALTGTPFVTVTLTGVAADVDDIEVGNDASFAGASTDVFENGVPYPLLLTPGDGTKTVFVRLTDDAGNTLVLSDNNPAGADLNIVLDVTPPAAPTVRIAGGAAFTRTPTNVAISLTATSSTATDLPLEVRLSVNDADFLDAGEGFTSTFPTTATFPAGDGSKTAFAIFRDQAGNETAVATSSIVLDSTAPCAGGAPQLVLRGTEPTDTFSNSSVVTVELVCPGGAADLVQLACDGVIDSELVVPFSSVNTCSLADGTRTVRAIISDSAGNATATLSDSIVVDRVPPTIPRFAEAGATVNTSTFAIGALGVASTDGGSGLRTANPFELVPASSCPAGTTNLGGGVCGWNGTTALAVPLVEGENRVRVRAVDNAGNRGDEDQLIIVKDTVAPNLVTNLNADAGDGEISLTWSPPAGSPDVLGYKVYYGPVASTTPPDPADFSGANASQGSSPIDIGNNLAFRLSNLPLGTPVFVGVTAYDAVNEGEIQRYVDPAFGSAALSSLKPNEVAPKIVSTTDVDGAGVSVPRAVAMRDGIAYVVSGCKNALTCAGQGLYTVDISNPASPRVLGSCSRAGSNGHGVDITLLGNFAYIANLQTVEIVDISDPVVPLCNGSINIPSSTSAVEYALGVDSTADTFTVGAASRHGFLFVAAEQKGVLIFDLTNPTSPSLVGTVDDPANPTLSHTCVTVQGGFVYACRAPFSSFGGVSVINIQTGINTDGASAITNTIHKNSVPVHDVVVDGKYLFLSLNGTTEVYDVSALPGGGTDVSNASVLATLSLQSNDLVTAGPFLYLTNNDSFDFTFDIEVYAMRGLIDADPQLTEVGNSAATPAAAEGICAGFFPLGSCPRSDSNTVDFTSRIAVAGTHMAEANPNKPGLVMRRIARPVGLTEVARGGLNGSTGGQGSIRAALMGRRVLYFNLGQLLSLDLLDPEAPSLTQTTVSGASGAGSISVVGDVVFLTDGAGADKLRALRLNADETFTEVASFTNPTSGRNFVNHQVQWPFAYVVDSTDNDFAPNANLRTIDLRTMLEQGTADALGTGTGFWYSDEVVYRKNLYVTAANGTNVAIANLNNPASPTITTLDNTGAAEGLAVSGNKLFVSTRGSVPSLRAYTLSTVAGTPHAAPSLASSFNQSAVGGWIYASGDFLFAAGQPQGAVLNVVDPAAVKLFGFAGNISLEMGVVATGKHMIISDRANFSIVQLE